MSGPSIFTIFGKKKHKGLIRDDIIIVNYILHHPTKVVRKMPSMDRIRVFFHVNGLRVMGQGWVAEENSVMVDFGG